MCVIHHVHYMVTNNPEKIIKRNGEISNAWFEYWLTSYVHKLIGKLKWFKSDADLKVGDVMLF